MNWPWGIYPEKSLGGAGKLRAYPSHQDAPCPPNLASQQWKRWLSLQEEKEGLGLEQPPQVLSVSRPALAWEKSWKGRLPEASTQWPTCLCRGRRDGGAHPATACAGVFLADLPWSLGTCACMTPTLRPGSLQSLVIAHVISKMLQTLTNSLSPGSAGPGTADGERHQLHMGMPCQGHCQSWLGPSVCTGSSNGRPRTSLCCWILW